MRGLPSNVWSTIIPILMIGTGALAALTPLTVMAASARLFTIEQQSAIAIAAGTGAFLAAIVGAAVVESRLADPRLEDKTYVPLWATGFGVIGGALLATGGVSYWNVCIGLPLFMVSLQLGRLHAVSADAWKREIPAALLLGAGLAAGVLLLPHSQQFTFVPMGIGVAAAVIARGWGARRAVYDRPAVGTVAWVTTETAVVAAVPYVTNLAVLAFLGPAETVAFRLVLSSLGILQPILGYLRIRLLNRQSPGLLVFCYAASTAALAALIILDVVGILHAMYGSAWDVVGFGALTLACLWKLLTIPETAPFAALRRRGSVTLVFVARAVAASITIIATFLAAALSASLEAVFVAFCISQVVTVLLYVALERWDGQHQR